MIWVKFKKENKMDSKCFLCLRDLTDGMKTIDCNHVFHATCIDKWTEKCPQWPCPDCRTNEICKKRVLRQDNLLKTAMEKTELKGNNLLIDNQDHLDYLAFITRILYVELHRYPKQHAKFLQAQQENDFNFEAFFASFLRPEILNHKYYKEFLMDVQDF